MYLRLYIYIGPHLLLANIQGGSPPPVRSGGEDQPLGSAARPVLMEREEWRMSNVEVSQALFILRGKGQLNFVDGPLQWWRAVRRTAENKSKNYK